MVGDKVGWKVGECACGCGDGDTNNVMERTPYAIRRIRAAYENE